LRRENKMDRMTIGCNITAIGSKKLMGDAKKDLKERLPDSVHVSIVASDGEVLVDQDVPVGDFGTGSVGYKLYVRDTSA
jgi:hypothetical protein